MYNRSIYIIALSIYTPIIPNLIGVQKVYGECDAASIAVTESSVAGTESSIPDTLYSFPHRQKVNKSTVRLPVSIPITLTQMLPQGPSGFSDSQQVRHYMSIADVEKVKVGDFFPIQDFSSFLARYNIADETNFLNIIQLSTSRLKSRSIDIGKLFHYGKPDNKRCGYYRSYTKIATKGLANRPIRDCYLLGNDRTTHLQIRRVHELREDVKLQMIDRYGFVDPVLVSIFTDEFARGNNDDSKDRDASKLCDIIVNSSRIQIEEQRLLSIPEDSLPQTYPGAWATTASSSQGRQSSAAAASEREDDAESVASTWGSLPNAARSLEYYVPRKVKRNSALPRQATPSIWAPAASVIDDDVASASGTEYSFPDTERSLQYYVPRKVKVNIMSIAQTEQVQVGDFYPIQDSASFLARYNITDETNFLNIIKISSSRVKNRHINIGQLHHYGKLRTNKHGHISRSKENISYTHITPHELPRRLIQDCYLLGNDGITRLQIYSVCKLKEAVELQMMIANGIKDPVLVSIYTAKFIETGNTSELCNIIIDSGEILV